jgi:RimJ/RimL family protein N-acetyltransferase
MNYMIRFAEFDDLPEILKIYEDAWAFMRQTGNPNQWWDYHPAESILREDIPKRQLYVCEEDGQIGAVFAYIQGTDPTYLQIEGGSWLNDEPYGVIHRMAFREKFQGKGLADRSFALIEEYCIAKGVPYLRIDTDYPNLRMQHILEKNGFVYCGTVLFAGAPKLAYDKPLRREAGASAGTAQI